jgi:pantoate--beta-alanine ligase
VVDTLDALRARVLDYRKRHERVALVPTMGALHEGHLSLVRLARPHAERVIVSIFVNPTQFSPSEDLSTYPRNLAADLAALAPLKTDLVWTPPASLMYPAGFASEVTVRGPACAGLEDAFRPHFFPAVATVVAKLLLQSLPDVTLFGEKDYQQLKVVMRLVQDLNFPTRVVPGPTIREPDGLAMSSRNVHLSEQERRIAPTLHRVLCQCAQAISGRADSAAALDLGRNALADAGFILDYLEARDSDTLGPVVEGRPVRLLAAARLGTNRLIDNIAVDQKSEVGNQKSEARTG